MSMGSPVESVVDSRHEFFPARSHFGSCLRAHVLVHGVIHLHLIGAVQLTLMLPPGVHLILGRRCDAGVAVLQDPFPGP